MFPGFRKLCFTSTFRGTGCDKSGWDLSLCAVGCWRWLLLLLAVVFGAPTIVDEGGFGLWTEAGWKRGLGTWEIGTVLAVAVVCNWGRTGTGLLTAVWDWGLILVLVWGWGRFLGVGSETATDDVCWGTDWPAVREWWRERTSLVLPAVIALWELDGRVSCCFLFSDSLAVIFFCLVRQASSFFCLAASPVSLSFSSSLPSLSSSCERLWDSWLCSESMSVFSLRLAAPMLPATSLVYCACLVWNTRRNKRFIKSIYQAAVPENTCLLGLSCSSPASRLNRAWNAPISLNAQQRVKYFWPRLAAYLTICHGHICFPAIFELNPCGMQRTSRNISFWVRETALSFFPVPPKQDSSDLYTDSVCTICLSYHLWSTVEEVTETVQYAELLPLQSKRLCI